jgi:Methyltransferase domain
MIEKILKILRLVLDGHRLDRTHALTEIRFNRLLFDREPVQRGIITYCEFLNHISEQNSTLFELLKADGEAQEAVQWARSRFAELAKQPLPFPSFYNADTTLALLSYALVRSLRPQFVLETGVGYGATSALLLSALERNGFGELVSVDLPSLADPDGLYVGLVVPEHLKSRWTLCVGSSRRRLPGILSDERKVGLFISDSANVYTLQRYEYEAVYPRLIDGGAALFNNIRSKFQRFVNSARGIKSYSMWQLDKPGCATGLVFKN